MRRFLERKDALTLVLAIAAGIVGFYEVPFPEMHPLLQLVQLQKPQLFQAVKAAYVAMLFTTPFVVLSSLGSVLYIHLIRSEQASRQSSKQTENIRLC